MNTPHLPAPTFAPEVNGSYALVINGSSVPGNTIPIEEVTKTEPLIVWLPENTLFATNLAYEDVKSVFNPNELLTSADFA